MLVSALTALLSIAAPCVTAKWICDNTPTTNSYPYCVNVPDKLPSGKTKFPTILYLGGSGTFTNRPSMDQLLNGVTSYDGVGSLLKQYRQGNRSPAATLVSEQFITIIPISPATDPNKPSQVQKHYIPDKLVALLATVAKKYPVDMERRHCLGYSAGSRGCWRFNVFHADVMASSVNVGAGAEKADGQYIKEQPVRVTFPLLHRLKTMPIYSVAGTYDNLRSPYETRDELKRLNSLSKTFEECKTDHYGLGSVPWTAALFERLLKISRQPVRRSLPPVEGHQHSWHGH